MKLILTIACVWFFSIGNTQTPLIAHKSHAGTSLTFCIDPSSNFGERRDPERFFNPISIYRGENFKPLNDSMIILEVRDFDQKLIKIDTLPNKERFSPILFQLKYQDSIEKEEMLKIYQEQLKREQEQLKQEEEQKKQLELQQQQINEPATSKKKEKKSYLLFLFGITGGGMLLMKLFSRSKNTQQPIASI